MLGSIPDLLRLVAVPVFGWAAYRDVRTRRVPNRTWAPLVALGVVLLAWDAVAHVPPAGYEDDLFLVRTALSVGFVLPLSYVFWRLGGFGGADAKALMTLAVLFPTYPAYFPPGVGLPLQRTTLGVFSMTVLTNTVILGLAYPLALGVRNAFAGEFSALGFLGRRVDVASLSTAHGRLFEDTEGFTRRGLDLDALRMYLRWRGATLEALRSDPDRFRDPASVGATHDPTDGAVAVDAADLSASADGGAVASDVATASGGDDPWAAARFLDEIEGTAYGTDAETLREGLTVVTTRDRVWVSPGIPFIVPMFVGLVVALTYGDVLFGVLASTGLV